MGMKKHKKAKKVKTNSLARRIVSVTVLMDAIFLILIMGLLSFIYVSNLQSNQRDAARVTAANSIDVVQTMIDETSSILTILKQSNEVKDYLTYLNAGNPIIPLDESDPAHHVYTSFILSIETIKTYSQKKVYDFIFVATHYNCSGGTDGCSVGNLGLYTDSDWKLTQRPWYLDYQKNSDAEFIVSNPYLSAANNEYVITFVSAVYQNEIKIGYVGIDLMLDSIPFMEISDNQDSLSSLNDIILVIKKPAFDPVILYLSNPDLKDYTLKSGTQILAQDLVYGYQAKGMYNLVTNSSTSIDIISKIDVFNQSFHFITSRINNTDWVIYVLVPQASILGLEETFLILLGAVLILISAISIFLSAKINKTLSPIGDILSSIEEIKNGNFDVRVNVSEKNELKYVADAINIMSREIGQQVDLVYKSFLYDSMSGLKNRRACHSEIEKDLFIGLEKTAICLIDVHNLKNINVTKGQSIGDELLSEFAKRLKAAVKSPDYVYANGSNEFIFIIPNVKGLDVVETEMLKVFDRLREPISIKSIKVEVKSNIGVAVYPYDGKTMDDLIKKCDTALFKAKELGSGNFVFYNDLITREVNYKAQINEQLAEALQKEQLYLKYQPLVDSKNDIYGFEALVRWLSPNLGEISPQIFIANAEESHLIIPIGTWILRESCLAQVRLQSEFKKPFVMSVNVSPVQIQQKDFIDVLKKVIRETDIDPHNLVLEITENVVIESTYMLERTIEFIHEIGAKIALDDFGTGYASLTYLRQLPFDNLKIDKSFVDGIFNSKKDHSIIGTIVELVHNLNMKVVAEGVETRKQYEFLKQISTDVFQGYLFSKPLLFEELLLFIDQFYKVARVKRVDVFANKDFSE
jgi:diguanylate cyclase (GGDEF)-like protein